MANEDALPQVIARHAHTTNVILHLNIFNIYNHILLHFCVIKAISTPSSSLLGKLNPIKLCIRQHSSGRIVALSDLVYSDGEYYKIYCI